VYDSDAVPHEVNAAGLAAEYADRCSAPPEQRAESALKSGPPFAA
jgi:hypothetical protein